MLLFLLSHKVAEAYEEYDQVAFVCCIHHVVEPLVEAHVGSQGICKFVSWKKFA